MSHRAELNGPSQPYFSVVVTTYNRAQILRRCVDSCLAQSFEDFEVVVVDDGSTDGTQTILGMYVDVRLRVVTHDSNRGINPARHTGVANSRGAWVVVVDSDWELLPHSLGRLHEITAELPPDIRVVRSRLLWDDGAITPDFMPMRPIDYEGRIRWVEEEGGSDAGRCIHRSAFAETPYISDRRGAMERLYELNLARNETSVCVEDVLGREHTDAPNSWLRDVDASLVGRLIEEADDMFWMAEATIEEHGEALRRWGPRQYGEVLRIASAQAFLLNRRTVGLRYAWRAIRHGNRGALVWVGVVLGLLGPRGSAWGTLVFRRVRARLG